MIRFANAASILLAQMCLMFGQSTDSALAQERQHVAFRFSAENSQFTKQQNIDVGDIPNHIVRVFEAHRTFPNNAPVINGLKLVEQWDRGIADYINSNGSATNYDIFLMENGDRFFVRFANVVQSTSGKAVATLVGYITGGTGKLAAMHGIVRQSVNIEFSTGFLEGQTDIEYSVDK